MRKLRIVPLVVVVMALFAVTAVSMQPTVQAQGENLLTNPGFEGAYSSFTPQTAQQQEACPVGVCTTAQMPAGWFPWWVSQTEDDLPEINRMPEYKPVCPFDPCPYPERLKSGAQALQYFTFHSTHTAGVWQRVNVPAGANLRFTVWGQAWSSASDQVPSDFPTAVNMRIGIDPTGGTNPFSGSIVWSGVQNPYDVYVPFEVEATAQGDTVTVFMWSAPQEARKHNDIYWDEASLTIGGGGSPVPAGGGGGGGTSGAPAVPVYVPGPTPTPNADGIILTQAQPGDSAWALAARAGLTLDEFLDLNNMGRNDFVKVGEFYVTGSGDPGGAPAEEAVAETEAEASAETEAEAAVEEEAVAAADEGAAVEGGAAVEEPVVEPTAEPVVEEAEASVAEGGSICLRAFDDANRDGVYNTGEAVKDSVAFTISNNEAVVSNYVTNGSEPFCVNGLPAGTYRVSRSFAQNEVASNSGDWAIALADGTSFNLDFGSYMDETAAQEVVAQTTDNTAAASENADTAAAAEGALVEAEDAGSGWGVWLVGIIVAIAAVLLIGVIVVVLSARRVA